MSTNAALLSGQPIHLTGVEFSKASRSAASFKVEYYT